jgi:hypothetical protein
MPAEHVIWSWSRTATQQGGVRPLCRGGQLVPIQATAPAGARMAATWLGRGRRPLAEGAPCHNASPLVLATTRVVAVLLREQPRKDAARTFQLLKDPAFSSGNGSGAKGLRPG